MTTITVSYNNINCTVGCNDIEPGKGAEIQWIADKTVSNFILTFSDTNAWSILPTAKNGWNGTLNKDWFGTLIYDIAVTPVSPGKCSISQRQKTPRIVVSAPIPVKK